MDATAGLTSPPAAADSPIDTRAIPSDGRHLGARDTIAAGPATGGDDPISRYTRATAPDGWLTAAGWLRLAADLDSAAAIGIPGCSTTERARALHDRAEDCRQRADRLTRGAP